MLATELLSSWPKDAWNPRRLLVGVSGGADSVALLLALAELADPGRLLAAHFNHGWRGAQSDADQRFVSDLCRRLGIACITNDHAADAAVPSLAAEDTPSTTFHAGHRADGHRAASADTLDASKQDRRPVQSQSDDNGCRISAMQAKAISNDSESSESIIRSEQAARRARYEFFVKAAYSWGASYVVTGHTADDRIETLLHNLFRGSGLAGAASLKQFRKLDDDLVLARPLIKRTRRDVLQFLAARGQTYCSDASNDDQRYARNYLRGHLLPAVRSRYPAADAGLLRFSDLVEEALGDIERLADRWRDEVDRMIAGGGYGRPVGLWAESEYWVLPAACTKDQPWSVLRAAFRRLWLERAWPMQALDRARWESLRSGLQSAAAAAEVAPHANCGSRPEPTVAARVCAGSSRSGAPRIWLVLPGAVRLESHGALLAIGRPGPASP